MKPLDSVISTTKSKEMASTRAKMGHPGVGEGYRVSGMGSWCGHTLGRKQQRSLLWGAYRAIPEDQDINCQVLYCPKRPARVES